MACADDVWYALIQWEDRFMSVIPVDKIIHPPMGTSVPGYIEGQLVRAKYGPKVYEAVICELHVNRKYLGEQAKLPPAYTFSEAKRKSQVVSHSSNDSGSGSKDTLSKHSPGAGAGLKSQNDKYGASTNSSKQVPISAKDSQNLSSPKPTSAKDSQNLNSPKPTSAKDSHLQDSQNLNSPKPSSAKDSQNLNSPNPTSAEDSQNLNSPKPSSAKDSQNLNSPKPSSAKDSQNLNSPKPTSAKDSQNLNSPKPSSAKDSQNLNSPKPTSAEDSQNLNSPKDKCGVATNSRKQIPTSAEDSKNLNSSKDRYGWEEESKSLRRKIRRLEERVSELEKSSESCSIDEDEQLMQSVSHLDACDVQEVMLVLTKTVFTVEELISCSRTGKKTSKCAGEPRPPFDIAKLEKLERVVRKKTQISKEMFVNKLENIQKVMRRRAKSN